MEAANRDEKEQLNERIREMERHMDSMLSHNKYEQIGIDGLNSRIHDMTNHINDIKKQNSDL